MEFSDSCWFNVFFLYKQARFWYNKNPVLHRYRCILVESLQCCIHSYNLALIKLLVARIQNVVFIEFYILRDKIPVIAKNRLECLWVMCIIAQYIYKTLLKKDILHWLNLWRICAQRSYWKVSTWIYNYYELLVWSFSSHCYIYIFL